MGRFIDLTGQRFGRLVPIKYVGKSKWLCKCDCNNEKIINGQALKNGLTKSCGCIRRETDIWTTEEIEFLKINYPINGPKFCINKLNRTFSSVTQKARILHLKYLSYHIFKERKIIKELGDNKVLCECKDHGIVTHYKRKRALPKCSLCEKQRVANYYKTPRGREVRRQDTQRRNLNPINNFASKLRKNIGSAISRRFKNSDRKTKGCFRNLDYTPQQLYNYINNIKRLQDNKCPHCQISYDKCVLSIDHVIPLERAKTEQEIIDLFDLKNLNLMCKNCNSSKQDRDYKIWTKNKCV